MGQLLKQIHACNEAIDWVGEGTIAEAWAECERADWMLWLIGKMMGKPGWPTHQELVRATCLCVRPALEFVPDGEERPRLAIEAAERWAKNPTTENRLAAAAAAYAAAYAAAAAAAADAADAAAAASYAAAYAAYAAAAAAAAAAYAGVLQKTMCDILRRELVFEALKGGE